ncbi:MAG: 3-isopropylmalate dehydratase [Candidatus Lokiarchaeota archaeon]|nr:3-isopropylmalate dehydratase [Candidatus Lokiarchaeota archaeon]
MKLIEGFAYIMSDNINTDDIVPSYALTLRDECEMAQCACENVDRDFAQKTEKLNLIVAGENFGCGSSREEAVNVFKILGIKAIVAKSFARIYFRNLINQGIPGITLEWQKGDFSEGDHLEIELEKGILRNITQDKTLHFDQLPDFLLNILEEGGVIPKLKNSL